MLLNHQAGLPAIRKKLTDDDMYNWDTMAAALAAQEPWWVPGTRHGYHALTIGFLIGEVMRRITGKSVGAYFRDEIAQPLGLDCHIGLDAREDGERGGERRETMVHQDLLSVRPPTRRRAAGRSGGSLHGGVRCHNATIPGVHCFGGQTCPR